MVVGAVEKENLKSCPSALPTNGCKGGRFPREENASRIAGFDVVCVQMRKDEGRTRNEENRARRGKGRFGNKWARIATYLTGRTDNDVKNFWSTRQKRLARILQTPSPPKSQKNNGKTTVFHEVPTVEVLKFNSISMEEASSSAGRSCPPSYMGNSEVIKMVPLPDLVNPNFFYLETTLPQLEFTPIEKKPFIEQLPFPQLDFPLLYESQNHFTGLRNPDYLDVFARKDTSEPECMPQFPVRLPFFGSEGSSRNGGRGDNENPATPDSFFDDFPTDMFDYLEPLPNSSEW
ncbi:hypothetical protein HHK36_000402 [Tetracentron sinense]|uniref:Uncharacterized protein n=1 Tax=Tetracentron sinense TaxID=13715 RepID=A0A835DPZ0_TETSI|nr:hypothetical protein HHK36_000402 [Tetracentron sinense]